jgi:hypothetical protein
MAFSIVAFPAKQPASTVRIGAVYLEYVGRWVTIAAAVATVCSAKSIVKTVS